MRLRLVMPSALMVSASIVRMSFAVNNFINLIVTFSNRQSYSLFLTIPIVVIIFWKN